MAKQVIKSERALKMIANNLHKKVVKEIEPYYSGYDVSIEEYLKGEIYQIIVKSENHILTKEIIDEAWNVANMYSKKYKDIYAYIDTKPYLTNNHIFIYKPVIIITVKKERV